MAMLNYYCLRAVGEEKELQRLVTDRVIITDSGSMFFNLDFDNRPTTVLDSEKDHFGDVKLYKTSYGRLLMCETNYIGLAYNQDYLIDDLQERFPTLMFHHLNSYYDSGEIYRFSKVENGKIHIGDDGLPIIESKEINLYDDSPWYSSYDEEHILSRLAERLDNNVMNLRVLKLKQVEERLTLHQG